MTTITIRGVPEAVRDQLAGRAAREGRSMQSYLLELLSNTAAHPTQAELFDKIREDASAAGSPTSTEWILEALDDDRQR